MSWPFSFQPFTALVFLGGGALGASAVAFFVVPPQRNPELPSQLPTQALPHASTPTDRREPTAKSQAPQALDQRTSASDRSDALDPPDDAAAGRDSEERAAADHDEPEGASLSDSIARLEAEYQLMVRKAARMQNELNALQAKTNGSAKIEPSAVALPPLPSPPLYAEAAQPTSLAPHNEVPSGVASSDNTTILVNAPVQNQQLVVVNNYTPIWVSSGDYQTPTPEPKPVTTSPYGLSIVHQRAINSPLSTQSRVLGTPVSPWAPIDISQHHNP